MNAKNGELAIARFDSMDKTDVSEERVCIVTGRDKSKTKFIYWNHKSNGTTIYPDDLPKGRVIRAVAKPGKQHLVIKGEFYRLTMDDVEPKTGDNGREEVSDTPDVQLGGCYHTGKAYCLGYRNDHDGEVELDTKIFTGLNGGVEGGAEAALNRHRENFDCTKDIPRFIVELSTVRIIDEDTGNAGCDRCGTQDREDGEIWCQNCLTEDRQNKFDICPGCNLDVKDCNCSDEGICTNCYNDEEHCDCDTDDWCLDCDKNPCMCDESFCCDCGELQEECTCEDICGEKGCWCDDLDDENVDKTFSAMNAFARARWLSAKKK